MFLKAKAQVSDCLTAALKKAMAEGRLPEAEIPEFAVEVPADSTHGDFASNIAMVSARVFRKSPKMIADAILEGRQDEQFTDSAAEETAEVADAE